MPGLIDFNVLLTQLRMQHRLGNVRRLIDLIPGLAATLPKEALCQTENARRYEAIILAMTPLERRHPELLDGARKARIARGSGTTTAEVGDLLLYLLRVRRYRGA